MGKFAIWLRVYVDVGFTGVDPVETSLLGDHIRYGAVQGHALVELVLEHIEVVHPVRLVTYCVLQGKTICMFRYSINLGSVAEEYIYGDTSWSSLMAVSKVFETFFPKIFLRLEDFLFLIVDHNCSSVINFNGLLNLQLQFSIHKHRLTFFSIHFKIHKRSIIYRNYLIVIYIS